MSLFLSIDKHRSKPTAGGIRGEDDEASSSIAQANYAAVGRQQSSVGVAKKKTTGSIINDVTNNATAPTPTAVADSDVTKDVIAIADATAAADADVTTVADADVTAVADADVTNDTTTPTAVVPTVSTAVTDADVINGYFKDSCVCPGSMGGEWRRESRTGTWR